MSAVAVASLALRHCPPPRSFEPAARKTRSGFTGEFGISVFGYAPAPGDCRFTKLPEIVRMRVYDSGWNQPIVKAAAPPELPPKLPRPRGSFVRLSMMFFICT